MVAFDGVVDEASGEVIQLMGKLQPNFSWQKYEGSPEDQKEQFQYQLQSQHIQVANSVNATIDDESFFTRERMTSFTWTDSTPIYTKTLQGLITASPMTVAHGITNLKQLVRLEGSAQDAIPMVVQAFPLPFLNIPTPNDGIEIYIDMANLNIVSPNNTWVGYAYAVTIYYTKTTKPI